MKALIQTLTLVALLSSCLSLSCLSGSCANLPAGDCAMLVTITTFQLGNTHCPSPQVCSLTTLMSYLPMLGLLPSVSNYPYTCGASTSSSGATVSLPVTCATKKPSKTWSGGGIIKFCTQDSDCLMADGTYNSGACTCPPRSDAKGVCTPDPSNTDAYGQYWAECAANNNTITNATSYNYWTYAMKYIVLLYGNLPCSNVFTEIQLLENLQTAYNCNFYSGSIGLTCPCTSGTYFNSTTGSCITCDSSCQTCLTGDSSSCTSCKGSAVLNSNSPSSCVCPAASYPNPDSANCASCPSSCGNCAGATTCTSCKGSAVLQGGQCLCPTSYYGSSSNCLLCNSACLNCTDSTTNGCIACKYGALLTSLAPSSCSCTSGSPDPSSCSECLTQSITGECLTCHDGFYLTSPVCTACDSTCSNCSDSGNTGCTACYANAVLQGSSPSSCACLQGYFPKPTARNCTACDVTCKTCNGTTPQSCLSCYSSAALLTSTCQCSTGFYGSPDASNCLACHINCMTCTNGTALGCTGCKSGATLQSASPSACQCSSGSSDPSNCILCASTCKNCLYTSSSVCTSCANTLFLVSGVCRGCPGTCNTCSGSDCATCYLPAVQSSATPKRCICPSNYYANPDPTTCTRCDETCASCAGAGSSNCTSCFSLAVLTNSVCVCSPGYYGNPDSSICTACDLSCKTCSQGSPSTCLTCSTNAVLTGTAPSSCKCQAGYYPSPDASNCKSCDSSCLTCSAAGIAACMTCVTSAQLSGPAPSRCVCNPGLTGSPATSCLVCDSTCQTCSDAKPTSCLSCKVGAALSGSPPNSCVCDTEHIAVNDASNCLSCDTTCSQTSGQLPCIQNCMNCFNGDCSKCRTGYLLQPSLYTCGQTCPSTYYPSNGICVSCSAPCITCSSASVCLTCAYGHALLNQTCVLECDPYFFSVGDIMCMPCDDTCETCNGPMSTSCLTCKPGYYFDGQFCTLCTQCAICDMTGLCLSCGTGLNLTIYGTCTSCEDCNVPLTANIGNPETNVFSVTFNRPVNHTFENTDFSLSTTPPAVGLSWNVTNQVYNSSAGRRLGAELTSSVDIEILSGQWEPKAVFSIVFTNTTGIADQFGQSLPTLNFSAAPPLGPNGGVLDNGDSSMDETTIIVIVVGSFLGALLVALAVLCLFRYRRIRKMKQMSPKKYEVVQNSSNIS